ncbi:MAG: dTMP kinase [Promethearchaeota archaeon]
MNGPKFIVLEGIDGSGTTSQARALKERLESMGHPVHVTQEPSDGPIGRLLRKVLRDPSSHPAVDALLFAADRVDHHAREITKYLELGTHVISDRYLESSIAYQGAQSMEVLGDQAFGWIETINRYAPKPDLTVLLDCDPEVALRRKGELTEKFEKVDFLSRVREIYLKRAEELGYPVVSSEQGQVETTEEILRLLKTRGVILTRVT